MPDTISNIVSTVQGMAQTAATPEVRAVGPGDVGPTTDTKKPGQLVQLPMTPAEVREWWKRIERSDARIKAREDKWDILLNEYLPTVSKSGEAETVKTNGHFRNVHSKIGQLFYRSPDLLLSPDDPSPAQNQMPNPMQQFAPIDPMTGVQQQLPPLQMEDIIAVKQAVLKKKMGRDGIKGNRLMDQMLFDVLAWAGIGCCKVGYRCVFKPIQRPKMIPDPNAIAQTQQYGAVLGVNGAPPPPMVPQTDIMGKPVMETINVPVHEEWYARRFSPKKVIFNDDLRSSMFDEDATMMGMHFYLSPRDAVKKFGITEEEASKAASDDRIHEYQEDQQGDKTPGLVECVELYVKASVYTDEVHPLALNQLILIKGMQDRPVVWRPDPDQEFDPNTGKLTKDSRIGFPYRVLTIRDLADSPFPPSDSAFTNSLIKQQNTWRRQSIRLRDACIGKYLYDSGAFGPEEIEQLKNGEIGDFIGVGEGKMQAGVEKIFAATTRLTGSVDDQRGQQAIKQDMNETLGISSVQSGVENDTVRTATEIHDVGSAMQARNEKELGRVVDCYLDIVRIIDQLLMRYMDQDEYINIAGDEGASRIQMWNGSMVSGKYLYDIAPDSQLRVDSANEFLQDAKLYNLAAPDPLFNRAYMLRRMARRRGLDPAKVVLDPMAQLTQPPHGGPSGQGGMVSQHQNSNSGQMPNAPGAENHREAQVK